MLQDNGITMTDKPLDCIGLPATAQVGKHDFRAHVPSSQRERTEYVQSATLKEMAIRAEITAAHDRLRNANQIVSDLCKPRKHPERRDWVMSIPARRDHDPDLVIGDALLDAKRTLAALEIAVAALEQYQTVDDALVKFTAGFAAKPDTTDPRSIARKALVAIEAALRGKS